MPCKMQNRYMTCLCVRGDGREVPFTWAAPVNQMVSNANSSCTHIHIQGPLLPWFFMFASPEYVYFRKRLQLPKQRRLEGYEMLGLDGSEARWVINLIKAYIGRLLWYSKMFKTFFPNTLWSWVLVLNSTPPARRNTHRTHHHAPPHTPQHNTTQHTSHTTHHTPHTTHHTPHRRLP